MKTLSLVFLFLALLFLVGCASQQPVPSPDPGSAPVTDVSNLGQDLSTLDSEDTALDTSDLEGMEDDLNVDF